MSLVPLRRPPKKTAGESGVGGEANDVIFGKNAAKLRLSVDPVAPAAVTDAAAAAAAAAALITMRRLYRSAIILSCTNRVSADDAVETVDDVGDAIGESLSISGVMAPCRYGERTSSVLGGGVGDDVTSTSPEVKQHQKCSSQ